MNLFLGQLYVQSEMPAKRKGTCGCTVLLVEGPASAQTTRDNGVAQAFYSSLIDMTNNRTSLS
jgi:hypothetical protein